ncbi:MAG: tetratricopeptide repeat protein [Spirochaetaceae bacterium]|nr:tetratricopeptide repeat protein [Spirochaetaceae bacterium]
MRYNAKTLCCRVSALLFLVAGAGLADEVDTATLRQAAEQGNPVAQLRLALRIDPGVTTFSAGLPDLEDADPEAYVEAAKWYRLAAAQGEPGAQRVLGRLYLRGNGVEQNVCESARWYHRAAVQGDRLAQHRLGELYATDGALQDYTVAAWWYRRAAEQGHTGARWGLGQLYRDGKGVPQDYVAAYRWIHLAALDSCEPSDIALPSGVTVRRLCTAHDERDRLAQLMPSEQIEEARRAARDWHATNQRSPGEWYKANRDAPVWRSEVACQRTTAVASADS